MLWLRLWQWPPDSAHGSAQEQANSRSHGHSQRSSDSDSQRSSNDGRAAEMTAKRTEGCQTHKRKCADQGDTQRWRRHEKCRNRDDCEGRKASGGYPRCLHRTRKRCLVDAKLVGHVGLKSVVRTQLLRHFHGEILVETALNVDSRKLAQLGLRLPGKLSLLKLDVCPLGVTLRADRNVFTYRHRHRSCY